MLDVKLVERVRDMTIENVSVRTRLQRKRNNYEKLTMGGIMYILDRYESKLRISRILAEFFLTEDCLDYVAAGQIFLSRKY